jgi:hypothetical protein
MLGERDVSTLHADPALVPVAPRAWLPDAKIRPLPMAPGKAVEGIRPRAHMQHHHCRVRCGAGRLRRVILALRMDRLNREARRLGGEGREEEDGG